MKYVYDQLGVIMLLHKIDTNKKIGAKQKIDTQEEAIIWLRQKMSHSRTKQRSEIAMVSASTAVGGAIGVAGGGAAGAAASVQLLALAWPLEQQ